MTHCEHLIRTGETRREEPIVIGPHKEETSTTSPGTERLEEGDQIKPIFTLDVKMPGKRRGL